MQYYYADGSKYNGAVHRMPNNEMHTGAEHTQYSVRVYTLEQLTAEARRRAESE